MKASWVFHEPRGNAVFFVIAMQKPGPDSIYLLPERNASKKAWYPREFTWPNQRIQMDHGISQAAYAQPLQFIWF